MILHSVKVTVKTNESRGFVLLFVVVVVACLLVFKKLKFHITK